MAESEARVEELFHRIVDLAPEERVVLLDRECAGEPALRELVERLAAADGDGNLLRALEGLADQLGELDEGARAGALSWSLLGRDGAAGTEGSLPRRIGDYELLREVGRGGMGVVFEACQLSLGRRVAVKILAPGWSLCPSSLQRFQREARAGGRLQHSGIVTVHSFGEQEGVRFIAQEFVDGARTLADRLEEMRGRVEAPAGYYRVTAALFLEIAEALGTAHESGVIHRDVKPSNILLTPQGRPKVADFGLATLEGDGSASAATGFLGTPFYTSPEQADARRKDVGPLSDVFSLGVTLYEALALVRPFEGESTQEILRRIRQAEPLDPRKLRSSVPRDLAAISLKALEKRPERRYATMRALASDLRRYLEGESVQARPPSRARQAVRWTRRHPALATALGTGSFALAVVTVVLARTAKDRQDLLRLADSKLHDELVSEAESLWPAHPRNIVPLGDWLRRARDLGSRLDLHQASLASLGPAPEDEPLDRRWRRTLLSELIADLEQMADPADGAIADVGRRLEFARTVGHRTVEGEEARALWKGASSSIADPSECPLYGGMDLLPQLGLVPIGRDPWSSLWEFAHLATGGVPERDPLSGKLVVTPETGLVFVLIPGGTFSMGAQSHDSQGPNYDPNAYPEEGPVHEVTLEPFFLSKYEVTQAQWLRATGENPSSYQPGFALGGVTATLLHPVEMVTWNDCARIMDRLGLDVPTEAQWEHAARGFTSTPWWAGGVQDWVAETANLADARAKANGGPPMWVYHDWDDGHAFTSPVGSFHGNPFGLHDVYGNVWEWCRDSFAGYERPVRWGDGERIALEATHRTLRGGCFLDSAHRAGRSAYRGNDLPDLLDGTLGVRPARSVER